MKTNTLFIIFLFISLNTFSQFNHGTTGLLNMPTAAMQKDKTFLLGGSYLDKHTTPARWYYNTFNYYLNLTIFPWLEVAYTCTLHKSLPDDPAYSPGYWIPYTHGKFVNQDRNFSVRLRIWKEGWWKWWTPQIVIGANDVTTRPGDNSTNFSTPVGFGNGFYNRYYIALTKHFELKEWGQLGIHLAEISNNRYDYKLNGLCIGANFRFKLKEEGSSIHKAINGLNLMAEAYPANGQGMYNKAKLDKKDYRTYDRGVHIDKYDINIGACYSFWKDRINLYGELYGCKDFSGGLQFKIHLK